MLSIILPISILFPINIFLIIKSIILLFFCLYLLHSNYLQWSCIVLSAFCSLTASVSCQGRSMASSNFCPGNRVTDEYIFSSAYHTFCIFGIGPNCKSMGKHWWQLSFVLLCEGVGDWRLFVMWAHTQSHTHLHIISQMYPMENSALWCVIRLCSLARFFTVKAHLPWS